MPKRSTSRRPPMESLLAQNALAFAALEKACLALAAILDHEYLSDQATPQYGFSLSTETAKPNVGRAHRPAKYLFPTLPQAIGIGFNLSAELRFICVADMSMGTFRSYLGEKLGLEEESLPSFTDTSLSFCIDAVPVLHQFDLQSLGFTVLTFKFCAKPKDFDPFIPRTEPFHSQNDSLSELQDIHNMRRDLARGHEHTEHSQKMQGFVSQCLIIFQWFYNAGLIGTRLGLLSVESLIWLCMNCSETMDTEHQTPWAMSLYTFGDQVVSRCFGGDRLNGRLQILTSSGRDLASSVSTEGVDAIRVVMSIMNNGELTLAQETDMQTITAMAKACSKGTSTVAIKAQCWTYKRLSALRELFPELIRGFQKHIFRASQGKYRARVWPFEADRQQEMEDSGIKFLLDVYATDDLTRPVEHGLVLPLLDEFAAQLTYDSTSVYIDVVLCDTKEPLDSLLHIDPIFYQEQHGKTSGESKPSQIAPSRRPCVVQGPSKGANKLRMAASAMDRLRWDPRHQRIDYEVGYVDRFENALLWKALEQWERATEEEEFVPEHRIRQIRRKDNGEVIWDREQRLDLTGV